MKKPKSSKSSKSAKKSESHGKTEKPKQRPEKFEVRKPSGYGPKQEEAHGGPHIEYKSPTKRGGPQAFLERLAGGGGAERSERSEGGGSGHRNDGRFGKNKDFKKSYKEWDRSGRNNPGYIDDEDQEAKEEIYYKEKNDGGRHKRREDFKPPKGSNIRPKTHGDKFELPATLEKVSKKVVCYQGEVQKNRKGFAFLILDPEDIFIPPDLAAPLITGDEIKLWYNAKAKEILKIDLVKRGIKNFIGTYMVQGSKHVVLLKDKTMEEQMQVRAPSKDDIAFANLHPGNKVLATIESYEPQLRGKILQDYGPTLAPKLDTLAVITKAQWPQEFSAEAQKQAVDASLEMIQSATEKLGKAGGRKDLRDKEFVTIDGKDSRDFDDAVLVEKTKSGFVLYVAIADVAEFVTPDSPLDKEAYERATSVYFPDYCIPMLPEALSNEACSLKPNIDRLTLTCEMHFDHNGKKRAVRVYESVINSKRRCIYEDVQEELKNGDPFWEAPFELFSLLKVARSKRGTIDLDLPEAKVVLDANGETTEIKKRERLDSHRLIEEFMIIANESVTEIMEREGWPFLFRIHEPPKQESLMKFLKFAHALGLKPDIGDGESPRKISAFLKSIEGHALSSILSYLILRSLKQAKYYYENLGHFGLASEAYTHFTSPIRRYPDLIVHRILKQYVAKQGRAHGFSEEFKDYLAFAADHCSKRERKADMLARTVEKVKKARFMANHLGEKFTARITNVSESGLFVELHKWFIEGFVANDEIGQDYFEFNEEKLLLYGRRSGRKIRIGDEIEVMVLRCDVDQGFVDFTMKFTKEAQSVDLDEEVLEQ